MSETSKRIQQLGIELPIRDRKGTGKVDAVLYGDLLYVSGQLPVDMDVETAYKAARLCGMNVLATIKDYIGELDRVDYIVKCLGLVNSGADFCSQPAVMNGFSDLMVEVFGRRGQHARSAMGAYSLPHNVPIVVEAIVKIRP